MNRIRSFCWLVVACMFLWALPLQTVIAGEEVSFDHRHQLGVRLGVWSNQGDTPPDRFVDEDAGVSLRTAIGSANAYFEAVGAYRLFSKGMIELSFGFVSRGDVTLVEQGREYIGSLVMYPMLVSFKYYLPVTINGKFYPYFQLGGGVYYGRHNVQFTNDAWYAYNEDSGTDLNYVIGGGFDWRVASVIGLELNARYMPSEFDKGLILAKDYTALTVTFGVKYLLSSKK